MKGRFRDIPIFSLESEEEYVVDFLTALGFKDKMNRNMCINEIVETFNEEDIENCGMSKENILSNFDEFIVKMLELKGKSKSEINSITILGGFNKVGEKEDVELTMKRGDIISIVGATGAGKSRLLGDIECLAQRDTPTSRQLLIDGRIPNKEERFSIEHKLVAQLSQNMNFVMDISVKEFITMHSESRMVENTEETVNSIIACANELAGERFSDNVPITQLSGGQSRALMIADTALLSKSPIVLIDEIENAGVDRKKALELLVKEEKIVLMSTHDPILALMGEKRIVIKNGGISTIIETTPLEKENLIELQVLDKKMLAIRNSLRCGEKIDFDVRQYFFS